MAGTPFLSAIIGLLGVAVGGLTSFASTWLTQISNTREKRRQLEAGKREKLFTDFVIEASRLYAIALGTDKEDIADLVKLYSLIGPMRLVCTTQVVDAAESAMRRIIETYTAPNLTLPELRVAAQKGDLNPLLDFDKAEASWQFKMGPRVALQPNVQVILHPAAAFLAGGLVTSTPSRATVVGLRTSFRL